MAAADPTVDLSGTTNALNEQNRKMDYAAQASAMENNKIVDSIDTWAKQNSMDIENLSMSNLSGDTAQMNATVAALTSQMEKDEMGAGEMYDELAKMHISLADGFEQSYNFDVQRWREEKGKSGS